MCLAMQRIVNGLSMCHIGALDEAVRLALNHYDVTNIAVCTALRQQCLLLQSTAQSRITNGQILHKNNVMQCGKQFYSIQ